MLGCQTCCTKKTSDFSPTARVQPHLRLTQPLWMIIRLHDICGYTFTLTERVKFGLSGGSKNSDWVLPPANEVWGKVMFLHLCVSLFTGGSASMVGLNPGGWWVCIKEEEGSASLRGGVHLGSLHPWGSAFGGGGVGRPPHRILQDTVNEWAVHILLEFILVTILVYEKLYLEA